MPVYLTEHKEVGQWDNICHLTGIGVLGRFPIGVIDVEKVLCDGPARISQDGDAKVIDCILISHTYLAASGAVENDVPTKEIAINARALGCRDRQICHVVPQSNCGADVLNGHYVEGFSNASTQAATWCDATFILVKRRRASRWNILRKQREFVSFLIKASWTPKAVEGSKRRLVQLGQKMSPFRFGQKPPHF